MSEKTNGSKSRALASWEGFQTELSAHELEITNMLPRHVPKERFLSSAVAAVKQNPELLNATPRSLFGAITQSAQDGLLPDGREGVITIYSEKQKDGSYHKKAKWNPMTWGLRKRARELDAIIIDCQVVHVNDHFVWHQGDEPRLEHEPAKLGTPRGDMIGAYAIFKDAGGRILHREVMDAEQISKVRQQSKQPDGLMWTKFPEEGFKKTALRRGVKSVPCSEHLEQVIRRDDDLFAFDETAPKQVPKPPSPPKEIDVTPDVAMPKGRAKGAPKGRRSAQPYGEGQTTGEIIDDAIPSFDPDDWLDTLEASFASCKTEEFVDLVWEEAKGMIEGGSVFPPDATKAEKMYARHLKRVGA